MYKLLVTQSWTTSKESTCTEFFHCLNSSVHFTKPKIYLWPPLKQMQWIIHCLKIPINCELKHDKNALKIARKVAETIACENWPLSPGSGFLMVVGYLLSFSTFSSSADSWLTSKTRTPQQCYQNLSVTATLMHLKVLWPAHTGQFVSTHEQTCTYKFL